MNERMLSNKFTRPLIPTPKRPERVRSSVARSMTTTRHIGRVKASTASTEPAFRVDLRAGAHELVADEPATAGGGDLGPTPFGFLLSGLAACTAMTLRMYAERKGWELTTIAVDVRYDIVDDEPGAIERTITVAADLPAEQRDRLADIAERTPVTLAVRGGTPITTTFLTDSTG
jgi:putative redox protein